jgi:glutamate-1-semialdehyde 2,1-aminomutase
VSSAAVLKGDALGGLTARVHADYRALTPGSEALFRRAARVLPGGVSGNLRYFAPHPLYMSGGEGAWTQDVDGHRYIDCFLCNGPLLPGHNHPSVRQMLEKHRQTGSLVLNPALLVACAEKICALVPGAEQVRFLNSGTEAVLTAVRYARAYTGRHKILKFYGHYHGQDDQFLVGAGPLRTPFGHGVAPQAYAHTLTVPFNDIDAVRRTLVEDSDVAAVVLDPAMHSGGLWGTSRDYLAALREITRQTGAVLIFDEVITGFRLSPGGAQGLYGVTPDLTTLAKALGAGERIAAVAGRAEVMRVVDPLHGDPTRRVFQSGTGNDGTAGLAAAFAALDIYRAQGTQGYARLDALAVRLAQGLRSVFRAAGIGCHINQSASMLQIFLTRDAPEFTRYASLDTRLVDLFYLALMTRGVMLSLPTSNHIYLSFAHGNAEIDTILAAAREVVDHYGFAEAAA